ncbi:hypothetical protein HRR83_008680 [Exophiala dermatitidis]|uniref:Uncharacterized protein n=1 Tax=Exophiala dermatitidis TaxID=5970 RepID=A0AAN6ET00_EXODE|nr:hypothetical protein HRR73_008495 [Exophiala dermatitidis]KAJ4505681.1 hypothetical protein HRR74_008592 [Exophiala dermatitidis]KAJ4536392.1 hypothetical protein HRR77_007312 [Exophiala dermatitidis]KAJ4541079.1 hypothetical protein HRR76_004456 [Exophiala dermatitidis]KAJ4559310.1 hypothetical protein HRR79_008333 [Exophiala dermatitidis]
MLYQFLLDDVARKPGAGASAARPHAARVDAVEGRDEEDVITKTPSLFRTRSTPRRTRELHYHPLQGQGRRQESSIWIDDSVPASPTIPLMARVVSGRSELERSKRLTM